MTVSSCTVTTVSTTTGQTFQISGSPVSVTGKVIPLPANSKIVTLGVPHMHGGTVAANYWSLMTITDS